jgi:hypothetical protein
MNSAPEGIPRFFELLVDIQAIQDLFGLDGRLQGSPTGIETVSTHPAPSDLVVSSTF